MTWVVDQMCISELKELQSANHESHRYTPAST